MKRIITKIMILLIIMMIILSSTIVFADNDLKKTKDSYDENDYLTIDHSIGRCNYNDKMMLADSMNTSGDLAKVSVVLSDLAYKHDYISDALKDDMGYSVKTFNYDKTPTYDDNDYVAFAIGHKVITYKGTTFNSYIVAIRGTKKDCQWYSNFNLGNRSDGYHRGFKIAADEVLSKIISEVNTSNNIILVTGHSRGAAVANIVAGELTTKYNIASSNHIFGYTFACPAVKEGLDAPLRNIYNYNNKGDIISAMPLKEWGYRRYGIDVELSTEKDIYDNFKKRFNDVTGRNYEGSLSTEWFVSGIKTIASTKAVYNQDNNLLLFDIIAWALGGKTNSDLLNVLAHHNLRFAEKKMIYNFCKNAIFGEFQYCYDSEYEKNLELLARIDNALNETGGMSNSEFGVWSDKNYSLLSDIKETTNITIKTRGDLADSRNELNESLSSISHFAPNLLSLMNLFNSNASTLGELADTIYDGHEQRTYILWIYTIYFGPYGWIGNNNITSIRIDNVTSIDGWCFLGCDNLTEIYIGSNVDMINYRAFAECSNVEKLTMPISTKYKTTLYNSEYCFSGMTNLKTLHYTKGTGETFENYNGTPAYYSDNSNYNCGGASLETVTFDEGIKRIPSRMFYDCKKLTTVNIPSTLEEIGDYTFYGCNNYKNVVFPNDLQVIGEYAFCNSAISGELVLPNKISKLNDFTFYNCDNLTKIKSLGNITNIGGWCFLGCDGLTEITIPDSVNNIDGYRSFAECGNVEKLTMPISTKYKTTLYNSEYCFSGMTNLKTLHYTKGTGETFENYNGTPAYYSDNSNYNCGGASLETVTFDEGIKRIPSRMFYDCPKLTIVNIPSTLEEIGELSFYGCNSLYELIVNKDCEIYDSNFTLSNNTIIKSHHYSKAKEYANKYSKHFVDICDDYSEYTVIPPTFEKRGYTNHKCIVCGYEYNDNYVDKLVKPVEPEGLIYDVNDDGTIGLSWTSDNVNRFNIYINGKYVKSTTAENILLDEKYFEAPGEYTIEVASVNSDNIESDKVSVVYVKGDDVETSTNVTTTNSQTTAQENTTQTTTAKPTTDATTNVSTTSATTPQVSTLSPTTQASADIETTVEVITDKETSCANIEPTRRVSPTQKQSRVVLVNKYKTKIKKIKAKKRALKITWKKVKTVNGYQIQYSLKKKFKKAKKITIKKAKVKSKTIKRLKSNKKYYVRIRTYCLFDGFKIYSKWSKVKSKKTK